MDKRTMLHHLTPYDKFEPLGDIYDSYISAVNNNDVHMIGLFGTLGSGKSTMIKGLEKKHIESNKSIISSNLRYRYVSLLPLDSMDYAQNVEEAINDNVENNEENPERELKRQNEIERQILNSLFLQFDLLTSNKKIKLFKSIMLITISVIKTVFTRLVLKSFNTFTGGYSEAIMIIFLILCNGFIIACALSSALDIFQLIQINNFKVKLTKNEYENVDEYYFMLSKILKMMTHKDLILVVEDIDRIQNKQVVNNVLLKLREIALSVNNRDEVFPFSFKINTLKIVSLMSAEIAQDEGSLKYFDFILPVVRYQTAIDTQSVFKNLIHEGIITSNYLNEIYSNELKYDILDIDENLIEIISMIPIFNDTRRLKFFVNDFFVYWVQFEKNQLKNNHNNDQIMIDSRHINSLLSLMLYKQINIKDFNRLLFNKGYLNELVTSDIQYKKEYIIFNERKRYMATDLTEEENKLKEFRTAYLETFVKVNSQDSEDDKDQLMAAIIYMIKNKYIDTNYFYYLGNPALNVLHQKENILIKNIIFNQELNLHEHKIGNDFNFTMKNSDAFISELIRLNKPLKKRISLDGDKGSIGYVIFDVIHHILLNKIKFVKEEIAIEKDMEDREQEIALLNTLTSNLIVNYNVYIEQMHSLKLKESDKAKNILNNYNDILNNYNDNIYLCIKKIRKENQSNKSVDIKIFNLFDKVILSKSTNFLVYFTLYLYTKPDFSEKDQILYFNLLNEDQVKKLSRNPKIIDIINTSTAEKRWLYEVNENHIRLVIDIIIYQNTKFYKNKNKFEPKIINLESLRPEKFWLKEKQLIEKVIFSNSLELNENIKYFAKYFIDKDNYCNIDMLEKWLRSNGKQKKQLWNILEELYNFNNDMKFHYYSLSFISEIIEYLTSNESVLIKSFHRVHKYSPQSTKDNVEIEYRDEIIKLLLNNYKTLLSTENFYHLNESLDLSPLEYYIFKDLIDMKKTKRFATKTEMEKHNILKSYLMDNMHLIETKNNFIIKSKS